MSIKRNVLIVFFICILISGSISFYLGQDANSDLITYHFYNGYALLNLKLEQDFFVASFMGYLNPILDFLNYLMIVHFPPKLTGFLIGAIQGLNFFFIILLSYQCLKHLEPSDKYRMTIIIMLVLLSLFCANVIGEIGTTFNDLTVSSLVILALLINTYIFTKNEELTNNRQEIFLAGICLGAAIGFKLTMIIYGMGAFIAFFSLNKDLKIKVQLIIFFSLGMALGFLIINGYWMILLWKFFKNPFFPLFNGFFKSPFYIEANLHLYLGPHQFWKSIFYPFYFSWNKRVGGAPVHDLRMACIYLLLITLLIINFLKRRINNLNSTLKGHVSKDFIRYFITFFITSYLLWQYQFSIERYMIILDLLSPLMIYFLIREIIENSFFSKLLFFVIFIVIVTTLKPMHWGRTGWTKSYFDVEMPRIPNLEKPTIVMNYGPPIGFLRPFFPSQWRFVAMNSVPNKYQDLFFKKISKLNNYQWYIIFNDNPKTEFFQKLGIQPSEQCYPIKTKIRYYFLCKIIPDKFLSNLS